MTIKTAGYQRPTEWWAAADRPALAAALRKCGRRNVRLVTWAGQGAEPADPRLV